MRNAVRLAASVGSAALILSGMAMAQTAVPSLGIQFGDIGINVPDGACGTGFTCTTIAGGAGTGFIQRQIAGGGETYIQTIIDDPAGGFQSEDFVQVQFGGQGSIQGVASKMNIQQGIVDDVANPFFGTTSTILAGWANEAGGFTGANTIIDMRIQDLTQAAAFNAFDVTFLVDTSFDINTNTNTLNELKADQTVGLGAATDNQRFYTHIKAADVTNAAPGYSIPGGTGAATWAIGDYIQVTWVGQDMATTGPFGSQTVQQIDPATGAVIGNNFTTYSSIAPGDAPGPWAWTGTVLETEFGPAPTF